MKIKITRTGYDPRLGPNHPDNRDPTLETKHSVEIELRDVITKDGSTLTQHIEYRWTCTCGAQPGEWKLKAVQAQIGGKKHVQAVERRRGK